MTQVSEICCECLVINGDEASRCLKCLTKVAYTFPCLPTPSGVSCLLVDRNTMANNYLKHWQSQGAANQMMMNMTELTRH